MRGHIVKRGKDSYSIVLSTGNDPVTGKRKRQWVAVKGAKKDAEKRLAELLHQLDTGMTMQPGKVTVAEFFSRWLTDYAAVNVRPRTLEGYKQKVEHNVIPSLGKLRLTQLQPPHLQAFYRELAEHGRVDGKGGLSPQTIKSIHRIISEGLSHAVRWGLIGRNVAQAVDPPRASRKEMKALDNSELASFLAASEGTPYRPLFELSAHTGLRRSELLGLRWKDIDLTLCSLSVHRAMHVLYDRRVVYTEPKSAKSRRTVSLTPRVTLLLSAFKKQREAEMKVLGRVLVDDDPVFVYADGSPMLPDGISSAFGKIAKKCGLSGVHLHSLRHTHASILLKQGIHPKLVQERLGHSSISLTLDTYSHVVPGLAEKAAMAFDEALKEAEKQPIYSER